MSVRESKNIESALAGARGSNAGDVFHELWALRAALKLLIPRTELKAVTVEGVAAPDGSGYQYDGVDCALFYGDGSLATASKIELIQLKCSTGYPSTPWTIAKLTASSAKKGDNSVLRKLSDTFSHASDDAAATADIVVRLVSNQPIAAEVGEVIAAIKNGETDTEDAKRFIAATQLRANELQRFVHALDFSEMGSGSRGALLDSLKFAVAEIVNGNSSVQTTLLQDRVRALMLPGAQHEKITLNTVLSWFGLASTAGLFPAPKDLHIAKNPILREPATELARVLNQGHRVVCLHGPAGCGKTTTLMQVESLLPPSSLSVTFDCYGAGRYARSNDQRHLPENAFLQIANELAVTQETPYLIPKGSDSLATISTFIDRVARAGEILATSDSSAILAILVDAADNSVTAATRSVPPSRCFVWDIANADLSGLPGNVRIIFSSRTGRKDGLLLPKGTPEVVCPPFSRNETAAFSRSRLPNLSDAWIDQLQALSLGVARVQTYAFAKGGTLEENVLEALRPRGKQLDVVLRELFQEAASKSGDSRFYDSCVAALATMPSPVPISHLATVCRSTTDVVMDFIHDVQPTLRMEDGTVTIADEDVEDFLTRAATDVQETLRAVLDYFADIYQTDRYAAVHYCDFLAQAGRAAEILPIVEGDLLPKGIPDPIESREVQLRRLRLALGACRSAENAVGTVKVVLLSAEAAKDEDALSELLERETDLSVRFANASLVRLVLADKDQVEKQGSILVQDAARFANAGDQVAARERLAGYRHWLDVRWNTPRNDIGRWEIDDDDLVALGEAVAIVNGAEAGLRAVLGWRPRELPLRIGLELVPRLIARGHIDIVEEAYKRQLVRRGWSLILTVPLALSGSEISVDYLARELSSLRPRMVPDIRRVQSTHEGSSWALTFLETIVTACEIALTRGVDVSIILKALALVLDHRRSPSTPLYRSDAAKIDLALRAWLMRQHLTTRRVGKTDFAVWLTDTNAPAPKTRRGRKKKEPQRTSRDPAEEELKRTLDAIFPIYESRLAVLLESVRGEIRDTPKANLSEVGRDSYYFDQDFAASAFRVCAARSIMRLMHIKGLSPAHLMMRAEKIASGKYGDAFGQRSSAIWQELLLRQSMHMNVMDQVADRAAKLKDLRTGARAKADAFATFSRLVLNFSEPDARALFETTTAVIQEIDREAMRQLRFIAEVADQRAGGEPSASRELGARYAAIVTDAAIRLEGEDHFPWERSTEALMKFAAPIALAAVAQWQDEGIAALQETLPTVANCLAETSPSGAVLPSALPLLLPHGVGDALAQVAKRVGNSGAADAYDAFELMASQCLLNVPPGARETVGKTISEAVPEWITIGPSITRLRQAVAFADEEDNAKKGTKTSSPPTEIEFPPDADFSTPEGISAAIDAARRRGQERKSYLPFGDILRAAMARITAPSQRIPFLNALANFEDGALHASDRATAIVAALDEWAGGPAVESWRSAALPDLIRANLWQLARFIYERDVGLIRLLNAGRIEGRERLDVIANGLEAGAENFSSASLFTLAELMAPCLERVEVELVAEWYVERMYRRVPDDIQSRFDIDDIPTEIEGAVGRFLFALMSDIDVRVRWRAGHCVRALAAARCAPLRQLFATYDRTTEKSYRLPTAPFYWMAARLWSVMTAARIAAELPSEVVSIKENLLRIALDDSFPHYLIRIKAKTALQTLRRLKAISLRSDEISGLGDVARPLQPRSKVEKRNYYDLERYSRQGERFRFNGLDTVSYWYKPIFEMFANLTPQKFFETLEGWLIDRWKVDPEATWWDKEARKVRVQNSELRTMHSHGSLPIIERYSTYLEWHVMFCGLGEWLKTEPMAKPKYSWDGLDEYAERWDVTEPPTWLADRRAFTPLERDFAFDEPGEDKHWLKRIAKEKFLAAVIPANDSNRVVVNGDWASRRRTRRTSIGVSAALVNTSSASALRRTLEKADRYKFFLPVESEREDRVFADSPFVLRPLLADPDRTRDTAFDDDDPLRHDVGPLRRRPAKWLRDKYRLKPYGVPLSRWLAADGVTWFEYITWADFDTREEDRYSRRHVGGAGHRLMLSKAGLRSILVNEDLDAIVSVSIERRLESEYGESTSWDDKKKNSWTHKVFVFRKDGSVEDESGVIASWYRDIEIARGSRGSRLARSMDGKSSRGEVGARARRARPRKRKAVERMR